MKIVKDRTVPQHTELDYQIENGSTGYILVGSRSDRIIYDNGPKFRNHRLCWKECEHVTSGQGSACCLTNTVTRTGYRGKCQCAPPPVPSGNLPSVSDSDIGSAVKGVSDQLDLNCTDGVLLYSGVLQAVPLVGAAFKLTSILSKAAKSFKKDLRRKPFTTAVKTLISGDFVDRFVISPTIDDARKFLDASNYVLRTLNTMQTRNQEEYTPLEFTYRRVLRSSESQFSYLPGDRSVEFSGHDRTSQSVTTRVKMLASVRYDAGAVDPIKMWASRIGITRPLEAAWDLVPFSFVIDYFTRAGDFISELTNEMNSQDGLRGRIGSISNCWLMTTQELSTTRFVERCDRYYATPSGFVPGTTKSGQTRFTRAPLSMPFVYENLLAPDRGLVSVDLSTTRVRTLAELFIQAKLR